MRKTLFIVLDIADENNIEIIKIKNENNEYIWLFDNDYDIKKAIKLCREPMTFSTKFELPNTLNEN